ncbi:abortive infection protein [Methylomonas lenta]|uniref:Abortive infection protein n=2 Tax=Methylomonas lenta TaxID=980561 RepID=A0A177MX83_9GAMM|nr:abortive infection protein [Methylomonas lenta]
MTRYLYYTSMPSIVLLAALSLACIVGYFIVQLLGDLISFRQIINRLAQLFLVLSIFPAMAYLKIDKTELGFAPRPMFLKQLLQGFLLGFVTLMPVFIVLYILGVNVIDEEQLWTTEFLAKQIIINLLIALLISSIEEPLFRGILLTSLSKKLSTAAAIIISSTYYAGLHFFSSKTDIPLQDITLLSGFELLAEAFSNLWNTEIISAFLALLMVGIFLGVLRTQTKASLGLCIGCHTCWVWQIKMSKKLLNTDFSSQYIDLVSSYDGVVGPLVACWLMLAIGGYFAYQRLR